MKKEKSYDVLLLRIEALEQAVFGKQKTTATKHKDAGQTQTKPIGHKCPDVIALLWQKGHFKQALSLSEIKKALDASGYSFTGENILMVLSRVKFLTRHGQRGSFTWKQKYPYHG